MDERPTHDDGTDELAAQLRRYADAAETAVPHAPAGQHRSRSPRWRPMAAAAAVLALVAGGAFAVVSLDDDRTVQTLEGTIVPDPAPDLEDVCPAPRADGPRIDDLTVLMPYVAAATTERTADDRGRVTSMRIVVEQQGDELRVAEGELDDMLPDGPNATIEICDPFAAAPRRTDVPGWWVVGQDRLEANLALTGDDDRAWLVTVSTPLEGRDPGSEQRGSARADLRRLIAGMSWPAPVGVPRRNDACADQPVATVGNHQLLAVPEGYTLGEPEVVDTGPVDSGGEQWTRLPLHGPDGERIDAVSIDTTSFAEGLANNAVGIEPGSRTIQRCRTTSADQDAPAGVEEPTEIRRSHDRIVVGAQEWEYGGWMVIGTGGATEDEVIAVAEAFRS